MIGVNVFEQAVEAAKNAGAVYPKVIAEFIQDRLSVVDTMAGPTVVARNGLERESLDAAMARLKQTENVAPLFTDGKLDVKTMDHELYLAVRRHNPELLGLRPTRR